MALKFKKNDKVKVISGKAKGLEGRILRVLRETERVVIEGVNRVKKHMKPNKQNEKGGIVDLEQPVHISNVMLVSPKTNEPVKVVRAPKEKGKRRARLEKKTGNSID